VARRPLNVGNLFIEGLTLRDWFAGQIICGKDLDMWGESSTGYYLKEKDLMIICKEAYFIADAMLKAREGK
jgi:hypothetical protein